MALVFIVLSMNIAILGANSQIAKDLISSFSDEDKNKVLYLFTRQPDKLKSWMHEKNINNKYLATDYGSFSERKYDAIINFVGIGDPKMAIDVGPLIFDITLEYDRMALDYLKFNPHCKYIFLSSGAVYGDVFNEPANEETRASIAINELQSSNWYSIAKLHAEARHRALKDFCIVDIRVFNYVSCAMKMESRFLLTDIVRSIYEKNVLKISKENVVRDYLGASDFSQLIRLILESSSLNMSIDCYSKAPIDKKTILDIMQQHFNLRYEFYEESQGVNATGKKLHYYSLNHKAKFLGYEPQNTSLELLISQAKVFLSSMQKNFR